MTYILLIMFLAPWVDGKSMAVLPMNSGTACNEAKVRIAAIIPEHIQQPIMICVPTQ